MLDTLECSIEFTVPLVIEQVHGHDRTAVTGVLDQHMTQPYTGGYGLCNIRSSGGMPPVSRVSTAEVDVIHRGGYDIRDQEIRRTRQLDEHPLQARQTSHS
nr:hypothetical protein CFP56_21573 [Quercus suber]